MGSWYANTGHRFGLTSAESAVMLFLAAGAIVGAVLRMTDPGFREGHVEQDYRIHDSVFAVRAAGFAPDTARPADVPRPRSDGASGGRRSAKEAPAGRVDINRAGPEALQSLPGIGPSTAARIAEYRKAHGPFARIEDIMNVPSIGLKKFEKIKPYLTILK
ncbi:MAG: helix-hairpin-helix domain-containing protein [Ignavibacteria bacterium]|nr:helix-hairpin-helix domain-containing protein [Ignavibacteria bacterium]